ncbi:hypothetical protein PsalN5692_01357 [Piscirickettsia salmonis]|uniref:hypothetical protein n=1 Tax=Piscirickettsia salmonis TaxID=1238 RepID=UPI0012B83E55|nr:hypothetical protein [Piscirickettsia salmonis]QGP49902.1 hypothetical protein PsalN5692_01357 [Piscirickettsia salmonis]
MPIQQYLNNHNLNQQSALISRINSLFHGVSYLPLFTPQTPTLTISTDNKDKLIANLCETDQHGSTLIQQLIGYNPDAALKVFALAVTDQDKSKIVSALCQSNHDGWTGLHMLARHATASVICEALTLAVNDQDRAQWLSALCQSSHDGWTGLHMFARYAPITPLRRILSLAEIGTDQEKTNIIEALCQSNSEDWTGWQMLGCYARSRTSQALAFAVTTANRSKVISSLCQTNKNGWSGLQILARYAPTLIPKVLAFATAQEDQKLFISAFHQVDNKGWSICELLAHYDPETFQSIRKTANFNFLRPPMKKFQELQKDYYPKLESFEKYYSENKSHDQPKWKVVEEFLKVARTCAASHLKGEIHSFRPLQNYQDKMAILSKHRNSLALRIAGTLALSLLGLPLILGLAKTALRAV